MPILETVTDEVRARVGEDCGLEGTLKFDLGDTVIVFIDAKTVPTQVSNDNRDAQCTIGISPDDLKSLVEGALAPTMALMTGCSKIQGDMSLAMKLQSIL
jgi:putative sterol carrier protein